MSCSCLLYMAAEKRDYQIIKEFLPNSSTAKFKNVGISATALVNTNLFTAKRSGKGYDFFTLIPVGTEKEAECYFEELKQAWEFLIFGDRTIFIETVNFGILTPNIALWFDDIVAILHTHLIRNFKGD
jgi:hypothetical protein